MALDKKSVDQDRCEFILHIHGSLGTMNIYKTFHGNPSSICGNISVRTKVVDHWQKAASMAEDQVISVQQSVNYKIIWSMSLQKKILQIVPPPESSCDNFHPAGPGENVSSLQNSQPGQLWKKDLLKNHHDQNRDPFSSTSYCSYFIHHKKLNPPAAVIIPNRKADKTNKLRADTKLISSAQFFRRVNFLNFLTLNIISLEPHFTVIKLYSYNNKLCYKFIIQLIVWFFLINCIHLTAFHSVIKVWVQHFVWSFSTIFSIF